MSVFGLPIGVPNTEKVILADGTATTVLSGNANSGIHVIGILLCNDTGGALTPIVDVNDGTNTFVVRDDASLDDQTTESVTIPGFLSLGPTENLRVTAAANLNVFVSYINIPKLRQ